MGINETFSREDNYNNPFSGLLGLAATITPVGIGAAYGIRSLYSNLPVDPEKMGVSTPIGRMGNAVGAKLRETDAASKAQRAKAAKDFAEKMVSTKEVQKLINESQNQYAVIQSMLSGLDDPESGLSTAAITGFKERLQNAAEGLAKDGDVKDTLTALFSEMYSNNNEAREVFRGRLREFKKVGAQLEIPTFTTSASKPFTKVTGGLSVKAQARLGKVMGVMSQFNGDVDVVESMDAGGRGTYARIYEGKGAGRKFITTLPLELAIPDSGSSYGTIRTGGRGTEYVPHRKFINASAASEVARSGKFDLDSLARSGALIDPEDYFTDLFATRFGGRSRMDSGKAFNSEMAELLTHQPRAAQAGTALGSHVRDLTRLQSNTAILLGLENLPKAERLAILKAAGSSNDFDLGSGPDRLAEQTIMGRTSFVINMKSGSAFNAIRSGFGNAFGIDRYLEPVTARLEQVWNRMSQASMYVGSNKPMGRGGNMMSGPTGSGSNILWENDIRGGTNQAFLLDVGGRSKGRLWEGLQDKGMAYSSRNHQVVKGFTIPVADPTSAGHGGFASQILNKVMAAKGDYVDFTREELRQHKFFLGVGTGPEGRYINLDPRASRYRLRYQETTESGGARTIHLLGEMEREMDSHKMFSRPFKGSIDRLSERKINELLTGYDVTPDYLKTHFGLDIDQTIVGSGEMYKKSIVSWTRQLSSGFGLASGVKDFEGVIATQAELLKASPDLGMGLVKANNPLSLATAATVRALHASGVDASAAGQVLALVYNRGMKDDNSWLKGPYENLQLDESAFKNLVVGTYGQGAADRLFASAAKGLTIGADTGMQGEGVGDWARARGSVEPRFIEMLQQRLRTVNMKESHISDLLSGLLQRKPGIGNQLTLTDELTSMLETSRGLNVISREKLPKFTIPQLMEQMGAGSLADFLEKHTDGIQLDISGGNDVKSEAMAAAAKKAGLADSLYLSGKTAISAMRGTFIKAAAGEVSTGIGSDYERLMENFGNDLRNSFGATSKNEAEMVGTFSNFSKNLGDLTAKTFQQLSSGQIKGSAYMDAYAYDMDQLTNLTTAQGQMVDKAMTRTKNTAIFLDSNAFLSMANDYKSIGGADNGRTTSFALETFYTGLETDTLRGVGGLSSRNPILSIGNVGMSEMFRDVKELGQNDAVFKQISESQWGQKALARFKDESIGSFADVAKSKNRIARKALFKEFTRNLGQFNSGGGGKVYFPQKHEELTYTGNGKLRTLKVDYGLQQMAGGDNDGDKWAIFMMNKTASQRIVRTISGEESGEAMLQMNRRFATKKALYIQEAKYALDRFAATQGYNVDNPAYMDALKEKASKEATGIADDALNNLRRAVMASSGSEQAMDALALLDVLEEHTTIKGKKLPFYYPYAEQLSNSINTLMKTGNSDSFSETIGFIFQGSDLLSEQGVMDTKLTHDLANITDAVKNNRHWSAGALGATANRIANSLGGEAYNLGKRFTDLFFSDSSFQAGMNNSGRQTLEQSASIAQNISGQAGQLFDLGNRKLMGGVVAGLGGAMVVGGLMSSGYDPQPLQMEDELSNSALTGAINRGEALNASAESVEPNINRYDMMQRPNQAATTYMSKGNNYQTSGEVNSSTPIRNVLSYLGSVHSSANPMLTVNDMRRPITQSYMDRLSGEY